MKIKLEDYCIVSNEFIKALNDFGIPKHFIETLSAQKLADAAFDAGELCCKEKLQLSFDNPKGRFLNSEIEI